MTTLPEKLTNGELHQIIGSHEKGWAMIVPINYGYLAAKELLAVREAKPVAWASVASIERGDVREIWPNGEHGKAGKLSIAPLFTAPPAPAVPGEYEILKQAGGVQIAVKDGVTKNHLYGLGWNACRAAMLNGAKP